MDSAGGVGGRGLVGGGPVKGGGGEKVRLRQCETRRAGPEKVGLERSGLIDRRFCWECSKSGPGESLPA
jgi:hypothetical protein